MPRWSSPASRSCSSDLDSLPAPVRAVFESAFGSSIGEIFLVAVPFAVLVLVLVLVAIAFIGEVPLRTSNLPERSAPALAEPVEEVPVR